MPVKEEFHTTINIRRPLGLPLERPREQNSDTFKYDLWIMINNYSKELGLTQETAKDPTNFSLKNELFNNIISEMNNMSIKNVFFSLWGYYFCHENINGQNIYNCKNHEIMDIYNLQKKDIDKILTQYLNLNIPKKVSKDTYFKSLEIVLIKYIQYFKKDIL